MKYVVTKRCHANEFIMVEAESIEEAFDKAENYSGKQLSNYLEFNGYQDKSTWSIEELQREEPAELCAELGCEECIGKGGETK